MPEAGLPSECRTSPLTLKISTGGVGKSDPTGTCLDAAVTDGVLDAEGGVGASGGLDGSVADVGALGGRLTGGNWVFGGRMLLTAGAVLAACIGGI